MAEKLQKRTLKGGQVAGQWDQGCRLSLPVITEKVYCLAQLDNYMDLPRRYFPHQAPFRFQVDARLSQQDCVGTWGFGVWNDPFSMGVGLVGVKRVLPVLPNAAWFFYGSSENYLSLRDDQPGAGLHAKTFRSPLLPGIFSLLAAPFLTLVFVPSIARLLRRAACILVREDAVAIDIDLTNWHTYALKWEKDHVLFWVDGKGILSSNLMPKGHLGFVLWLDNQYFRFDPQGVFSYGTSTTDHVQSLEIKHLVLD